jgi:hypothetical protein
VSDLAEYFRDLKEHSQRKRASNRQSGQQKLAEAGVPFTEHNGGAHLIVQTPAGVVDFWPGTGKWILRGTGAYCRGVDYLLWACKVRT